MKGKKFLALTMAGLIATMTGCSNGGKKDNAEIPTLNWYVVGDLQDDTAAVCEQASKITEEKIGAKLNLVFIEQSAYGDRMKMNLASKNEDVDLLFTGYCFGLATQAQLGGLAELDELMEEYTPEYYKSLPQYLKDACSLDGALYGVANQQINAMSACVALRKDLVEKYNFDVEGMKNYKDLEVFLEQIKQNEPDLYPYRNSSSIDNVYDTESEMRYEGVMGQMLYFDNETNKIVTYYDREGAIEDAKRGYEFFQKGYIRSDQATLMDDSTDYKNGRYAVITATYKPGVEMELKNDTGYEYVTKQTTHPFITAFDPAATCISVSQFSKNKEKAVELIELLNTDKELYNLICWGIEGTHYNKVGDNRIELIEGSKYCPNASWKFGCVYNSYIVGEQSDDVWEQTKKLNDEGQKSKIMGLVFNNDNVLTEIAQVQKVSSEYVSSQINKHASDPEKCWDEYIAAMEQAGIRTVAEEYQRQIDEFLAK